MGVHALQPAWGAQPIELAVLSSQPDMVSGGAALVQLNAPGVSGWTARLDGRNVTTSFRSAAGSDTLVALLSDLKDGKNVLEIQVARRVRGRLELVNHSLSGPIFSGPHVRARLIAANGTADNQVILTYPRYSLLELWSLTKVSWTGYEAVCAERAQSLVEQMNQWLNNIATDKAAGSASAKVVRNKPAELSDGCWATNGEHIVERATYGGPRRCNQLYPAHADPRIAAGDPWPMIS